MFRILGFWILGFICVLGIGFRIFGLGVLGLGFRDVGLVQRVLTIGITLHERKPKPKREPGFWSWWGQVLGTTTRCQTAKSWCPLLALVVLLSLIYRYSERHRHQSPTPKLQTSNNEPFTPACSPLNPENPIYHTLTRKNPNPEP